MKLRIHLAVGYLTVSLLLTAVAAVSYRNAQTLINAGSWVAHTDQVLAELESVRGKFRELYDASRVEPGTSGEQKAENQASYRSLAASLQQHLVRVRALTEDNLDQQQLVSLLEQDIARKGRQDELKLGLRPLAANEVPPELSIAGERAQVQEIFQLLASMRTKEEALLHERTMRANQLSESTMEMIGVISLGALVVFTLSYWLLGHSLRARERVQQNLAESEALYKDLFDGTSDLIQLVSPQGRFLYTNRAWQKALGYTADEVSGLRLDDVVHPEDLPYAKAILMRLMAGEAINGIEVRVRAKNGQVLHIQGNSSCRYVKGKPFSTRGMYRDVTERTRTEMQLKVARQQLEAALAKERELSRLDALTGVGNRRAFYEVLEAERSRAVRYSRPLTVAYLDLDNFKKVNDSKGHGAGDLLLTKVANKLRTSLRITDFVSRLGGDEFAVVLPETNVHAAEKVLEKLRVTLLEETSAHYCEVTFSIGAVTFLNPKDSLEVMVRIADETMYTAKTNGKNRTCLALVG